LLNELPVPDPDDDEELLPFAEEAVEEEEMGFLSVELSVEALAA
jgi:hypothetical protein